MWACPKNKNVSVAEQRSFGSTRKWAETQKTLGFIICTFFFPPPKWYSLYPYRVVHHQHKSSITILYLEYVTGSPTKF